jgi:hypothetical protein
MIHVQAKHIRITIGMSLFLDKVMSWLQSQIVARVVHVLTVISKKVQEILVLISQRVLALRLLLPDGRGL